MLLPSPCCGPAACEHRLPLGAREQHRKARGEESDLQDPEERLTLGADRSAIGLVATPRRVAQVRGTHIPVPRTTVLLL